MDRPANVIDVFDQEKFRSAVEYAASNLNLGQFGTEFLKADCENVLKDMVPKEHADHVLKVCHLSDIYVPWNSIGPIEEIDDPKVTLKEIGLECSLTPISRMRCWISETMNHFIELSKTGASYAAVNHVMSAIAYSTAKDIREGKTMPSKPGFRFLWRKGNRVSFCILQICNKFGPRLPWDPVEGDYAERLDLEFLETVIEYTG